MAKRGKRPGVPPALEHLSDDEIRSFDASPLTFPTERLLANSSPNGLNGLTQDQINELLARAAAQNGGAGN